jgi:hypothetical protein
MKRRTSGQVLIGAATLMLVILLTMAASLPVINTSIDPSSKVYNLARKVVRSAVEDFITRMSAYQCATALWYADERHKKIDFTGHAKEIENRVKNSLTQSASKSYNLELRSVSVAIPVAKIVISSTVWDGNPKSASAGEVEISMAVHVYVSFEYRIKNSGANFQKYTAWYEEYLKIEGEGEVVKNEPWQGLPWVEFGLSFVPIVGALVGNIEGVMFALPLTVTRYSAVFDKRPLYPGVELDDLTDRLELVMLKPRDKVERFGGLTERYVGFTSIQYRFETIRWVEYNKIDWGAIAIGIAIDFIIPGGRVVGTAARVKQDITNDSPETLYFMVGGTGGGGVFKGMQDIWNNMVKKDIRKVEKIEEKQKTTFGFHKDQQADVVLQYYEKLAKEGKKVLEDKAIQQTLGQIEATITKEASLKEQSQWKYAFEQYKNSVRGYSQNIYGTYMRTEGVELYQSTAGGGKIMDYYANRNPLVWVGLPLHNGKSLFGVCVWLIGAYYSGDA